MCVQGVFVAGSLASHLNKWELESKIIPGNFKEGVEPIKFLHRQTYTLQIVETATTIF